MIKELKDMSPEELREQLLEFRLQRKSGFDRKVRGTRKKKEEAYKFQNADVGDDLAAFVLAELKKKGTI